MKILQIETTNHCNGKCIFCVHDKIRKFGVMSNRLFKKVLNDVREIETLETIVPMMTGEPFMDPNIINRLKQINRMLPGKEIKIFTNGSLIKERDMKDLSKIKDLMMFFSLNGACDSTREKLMGLSDYEKVKKTILNYEYTGKPFKVILVIHPNVSEKEAKFFSKVWEEHKMLVSYANFVGDKFNALEPKRYCKRAIEHMTVMYDGKVNLCCMDALGKTIFGDLNDQTVKEVWESPKRQSYVKAHLKGEIPRGSLCGNCSVD